MRLNLNLQAEKRFPCTHYTTIAAFTTRTLFLSACSPISQSAPHKYRHEHRFTEAQNNITKAMQVGNLKGVDWVGVETNNVY